MRPLPLLASIALSSCVIIPPPGGDADGGTSAGGDETPVIDGTTPLHETADYASTRIKYRSGGYDVFAVVCAPKSAGRHPVVLWNHGGFDGLGGEKDGNGPRCEAWAKKGFVFAASSYRGEDGSDGHVEFCGGEVTDVRNLLKLMHARDDVDSAKTITVGESHGACISAELAATEPSVKAAAAVNGIYDMGAWNTWLGAQAQTGDPLLRPSYAQLHQQLDSLAQSDPGALDARSPAKHATVQLAPIAVFHGQDDLVVPPEQACLLRAALAAKGLAMDGYYVDANGHVQGQPPGSCGAAFQGSIPPTPSSRSLRLYEGEGHALSSSASGDVDAAIDAFMSAQLGG